jgi:hypothetical protein
MNNIFKALLGNVCVDIKKTSVKPSNIPIEVKHKPPRKPRAKPKSPEDPITEKEIQAAMKRIKKVEAEARKRLAEEELKSQNVSKGIVKTPAKNPTPKKKQPIPNHVKTLIWNHWVGCDKAEAYCLCCKVTKISIRSFHAGHIIAESKGGDMTVKNLKPICGPCNLSMGSMNMDEFIKKFGLGK